MEESRGITPALHCMHPAPPLQCGFDASLSQAIAKAGYERPTAIQAQALPAALSGRDVLVRGGRERCGLRGQTVRFSSMSLSRLLCCHPPLQGIAMTGSGKTAAFVLPMIVHIMDQPELKVCAACLLCWDVTECRPASHCVSDQPAVPPAPCPCLQKGEGPIAVIVAPTRELSEQIHKEARASWPSAGCC